MLYFFAKILVPLYYRIIYRIKVIGLENVPAEGGVLLCPNHAHYVDPILMAVVMRRKKRKAYFMAKKEIFSNWFFRWALGRLGAFPVERGTSDLAAFRRASELLEKGETLCLFAQGRRLSELDLKNVKMGVGLFALKARPTVIPVGISGKYSFFSKLTVNFGEPVDLSEYDDQKIKTAVIEEVTEKIMSRVGELLAENEV